MTGDLSDMLFEINKQISIIVGSGCNRIIVDLTTIGVVMDMDNAYQYIAIMSKYSSFIEGIAFVFRSQLLTTGTFWETVALNRGFRARSFTQIHLAKLWLLSHYDESIGN